jgi:hypothetical protein
VGQLECDGPCSGVATLGNRAHIRAMGDFAKIAVLAVLALITLGVFPNRWTGAVIAIGTCVVAAVVLHFVAP